MSEREPGWAIGVDEAGRGPAIGPLVVAALAARSPGPLMMMGVRDSKNLTPARRSAIFDSLKESDDVVFEYMAVSASELDSLMAEVSLNVVEERLFASVVSKLLARMPVSPGGLFLDACDVNEERFGKSVVGLLRKDAAAAGAKSGVERGSVADRETGAAAGGGLPEGIRVVSEHRADSAYSCVSAASIVAKVVRDAEMDKIRKELGMTMESMGSGYPADIRTKGFLENWIKEKGDAPPHARRSWKTIKKLLVAHASSQKRLTDFQK